MKTFEGTVVSSKMQKTVVVAVRRPYTHPLYKKVIWRTTKLKAHTDETYQEGDIVKIAETRPVSKSKYFKVINIVRKVS